jgi:hypothetical protein
MTKVPLLPWFQQALVLQHRLGLTDGFESSDVVLDLLRADPGDPAARRPFTRGEAPTQVIGDLTVARSASHDPRRLFPVGRRPNTNRGCSTIRASRRRPPGAFSSGSGLVGP